MPAIRDSTTNYTTSTTGTTIVIDAPVCVQNDLLLAVLCADSNNTGYTWSLSNWLTAINQSNSTNGTQLTVLYKIAGAGEPASYTFTRTGAETFNGGVISIRDVNTTSPFGIAATGSISITVAAAGGTFTRTAGGSGSFVTDGFVNGQTIVTAGFTNAGNNTTKTISNVAPTIITVSSATGLVNESGSGKTIDNIQYVATTQAAASKYQTGTLATNVANSLIFYASTNASQTGSPTFIEGPVNYLYTVQGTAESSGVGWGFQAATGTTPAVYCASPTTGTGVKATLQIAPPVSGATVIPAYGPADASVYLDPIFGTTLYNGNTAFAATATNYFGTTLGGLTLANGTVAAVADSGLNTVNSVGGLTTTAAGNWSGATTVLSGGTNISGKNIIVHTGPPTPLNYQRLTAAAAGKGVAFGMASSANNFKIWQTHGRGTAFVHSRDVPMIINSANTSGVIGSLNNFDPASTLVFGYFLASQSTTSQFLYFSLWMLDTITIAGGNASEPVGVTGIVQTIQGHEHRGALIQGSGELLLLMPVQIGNGGTDPTYLDINNSAIEFPTQYNQDTKIINYCSADNVAGLTYYAGPGDTIKHRDSIVSSGSRFHWKLHASSFINTISVNRARSSNVATVETSAVHGLTAGNKVLVTGMGGTGYTGSWTVASVPDTTHFTYTNTGDNESETADTGGIIGPVYDFSGLAVIGAGTISLARAIHITNLTINNYSTLDMTDLNFDAGTITNVPAGNDTLTTSTATLIEYSSINVTGVTAGNRWCSVTTPVRFENNTFTGSATTGHAIRITSPGTYSFVGNVFNGFGANGSTSAAILNESTNLVTLNISGTTNIPTYKNIGGATTVVAITVTLTIEIRDSDDGTIITKDCEVTVVKVSDESVLFQEDGITDGLTSYQYTSGSGTDVYINVLNVGDASKRYQNKTIFLALPASNETSKVFMDVDRIYANP